MSRRLELVVMLLMAGLVQAADAQEPQGFVRISELGGEDAPLTDDFAPPPLPPLDEELAPVAAWETDDFREACDAALGCDQDLGCDSVLGCDGGGWLGIEDGCDGCLSGIYEADRAKFYLGIDFSILKPDVDSLNAPQFPAVKPDQDFEIAPRYFLGFENARGFGMQASYWRLQTTGDNRTSFPQIGNDLKLQTAELDLTKTNYLGPWAVQLGAGGRWGRVDNDYFVVTAPAQNLLTQFDGAGPTFVANVRRPLGCGGWALVGEGRASFLFGDTDIDSTIVPGLQGDDGTVKIWEGRAGIEWIGTSANGCAQFFVRALFEGQFWDMPSIGPLGSTDIDFLGPTMSMGFIF